jgi:serine/threonine-protein kinase
MVMFLSQQEDPFDQFRENVNLFIEHLPQPMTVEQVAAANRETMLQQMPINFVQEATKDTLGSLPAYRVAYTGPLGQLAGKWLQYYAVKGNKAYTLTYTAEAPKYQKFLGLVQQIIASLEIK